MAGTNELDHLRKETEKAIVQANGPLTGSFAEPDFGALANARATLYLAEVIRWGLGQLVVARSTDLGTLHVVSDQPVVKSGPEQGWCGDCGGPFVVKKSLIGGTMAKPKCVCGHLLSNHYAVSSHPCSKCSCGAYEQNDK